MIALKPSFLALLLPVFAVSYSVRAGEEVDRLLTEYSKIETVTCQIRRTKSGDAGKVKFLSRVYWAKGDKIHAEGVTPFKRRTIADGKRLYQYVEESPKGFSRTVEALSKPMLISLRFVPGTAMDHLLRLVDTEEAILPPQGDAVKRVGIEAENNYVVLSFDVQDRLVGIDFFKTPAMQALNGAYQYRDFSEVIPGVWVPLTHEAVVEYPEMNFKEVVKVDRFIANKPVPESFFIANNFFGKDVDFVEDFKKIHSKI